MLTLSVIGHSEVGVFVDMESLPVSSTVRLQALETHKPPPPVTPSVNNGHLHPLLLFWRFLLLFTWPPGRVRHHQKHLR